MTNNDYVFGTLVGVNEEAKTVVVLFKGHEVILTCNDSAEVAMYLELLESNEQVVIPFDESEHVIILLDGVGY